MKKKIIYPIITALLFMFTATSCFQDLENDPPFDYPEEPDVEEPPVDETGLLFYMAFDGDYIDAKSEIEATKVGSPSFGEGQEGQAYKGAADSYLTFNTADLVAEPETDFTVAFWYKVDGDPDRGGILTMGPPTEGAGADAQNNRNGGFRIFREGNATRQVIKANVGTGTTDVWMDGGDAAALNPTVAGWVHIAMTVSSTKAIFYFDGLVVSSADFAGISWEGCDILSIGSGAPRFTEWNHLSDLSLIDELRLYNKTLSADEITDLMAVRPALDVSGQLFYAPFNSTYKDIESNVTPAIVGTPTLLTGKAGKAYSGETDSYLTYNMAGLKEPFGTGYSVTFWYKVNAEPNRAGIITISADDPDAEPDAKINRTKGLRIFREASGDKQIIKGNVGIGDSEVWVDGGAAATVDPAEDTWVHVAVTLSDDMAILYLDGVSVKESALDAAVDWTDCEIISVGSGAPYYVGWNHLSDLSLIDELRMYNKTLTETEIAKIIAYDN